MAMPALYLVVIALAGAVGLVTRNVVLRAYDPWGVAARKSERKRQRATRRESDRREVLTKVGEQVERVRPMYSDRAFDIKLRLARAGLREDAATYIGAVWIAGAMGLAVGIGISAVAGAPESAIPLGIVGVVIGALVPRFYVSRRTAKRKARITADLPYQLELLAAVAEAGQTIERGMREIAQRGQGPLAAEFARAHQDVSWYGRDTATALNDMARRCDVPSVGMFVKAVNQAQAAGSPIVTVLQKQAQNAQDEYYTSVEEASNKLPIKIVVPQLLFLLLPSLVIAIGPMVISAMIDTAALG